MLAGTRGHPFPNLTPNVDPVEGLVVERPVELDVDPHLAQMIDDSVGDVRPLVAAYGDPHKGNCGRFGLRLDVVRFTYIATLDCADPVRLAPFWAAALHYRANPYHAPYLTLTDPTGKSPELILQKVPEPKRGKNRMHLDLFDDDIDREARRIESLGARRLSKEPVVGPTGDRWIVMADPEGNEFCVCEGDVASLEE